MSEERLEVMSEERHEVRSEERRATSNSPAGTPSLDHRNYAQNLSWQQCSIERGADDAVARRSSLIAPHFRSLLARHFSLVALLLVMTGCTGERKPEADALVARTDPKAPIDCRAYLGTELAATTNRTALQRAFGAPDSLWVTGFTNVVAIEDSTAAVDTMIKLEYHEPTALFELQKPAGQPEVLLQAMIWDNAFLPSNAKSIGQPVDSVHRRLGPPFPRNEGLPPRNEPPRSLYVCADSGLLTFWTRGDTVGVIEYNTLK